MRSLIPMILGTSLLCAAAEPKMNSEVFAVDRKTEFYSCVSRIRHDLARYISHNSYRDYLNLIDELADTGRFRVLTGRDFLSAPADPKWITVYLRHDIDNDPLTAQCMAEDEHAHNLHGSYYIEALYQCRVLSSCQTPIIPGFSKRISDGRGTFDNDSGSL